MSNTEDSTPALDDPTRDERWVEHWEQGNTRWHLDEVNPALRAHVGDWTRVLVPLCGASLDLSWLAERGMEVVGVELAELPCRRLFEQWGHAPDIDTVAIAEDRSYRRYRAKNLTVLQGDMLALGPEHAGSFDGVWDRGSLVALPPALRSGYVAALGRVAAGADLLLATFLYDPGFISGPPHSFDDAAIDRYFDGATLLEQTDMTAVFNPEAAQPQPDAGPALVQRVHRARIRPPSDAVRT